MQKITPFLWYDGKAEEAAKFYTSIFKNSKIVNIRPGPQGSVMGVEFQLEGQDFIALNGGPRFTFSPAISFFVSCNVFTRKGGTIRHFWSSEMGAETADPGQDPRGAPDFDPLWTILDTTPEGRGADWYPKLEYGKA